MMGKREHDWGGGVKNTPQWVIVKNQERHTGSRENTAIKLNHAD